MGTYIFAKPPETNKKPIGRLLGVYWALSKSSIVFLVVVTAAMGYLLSLGGVGELDWLRFVWALTGTGLMCAGACAFNHVVEANADSHMKRTQNRPIPSGQISKRHGFLFGFATSAAGAILLAQVSWVMVVGGVFTVLLYIGLYTPLKQRTKWNTLVGAVPGALPAMGGSLAASNELSFSAVAVFLLIYAWQQPHFHAIAFVAKDDYRRGNFKMLTVTDPTGRQAKGHIVLFSLVMVGAAAILTKTSVMLGVVYALGSTILGLWFVWKVLGFCLPTKKTTNAKNLIKDSVVYIQILFLVMLVDFVIRIL